MVNRLILSALQTQNLPASVVSLMDRGQESWHQTWPASVGAAGSRVRFVVSALCRRAWARDSIILATHVGLAPVARLVKSLSGAKVFVFLHGVEAWRPLPRLTKWGLRGCDRLIANSEHTLREFRQANPSFGETPAEVCPLPARRLPTKLDGDVPARLVPGRRVLIVGRLWGRGLRKGQRELITLWPRVITEFPDAELWIVGGGEGRSELEELARTTDVASSVRFAGEVSDEQLAELYALSAVYAMPSWGEGFGLVFAEAMFYSLPCIASRFDAGSEVVVDGITGFVVDPQAPEEILDRLRRLLGDPALRERMGKAGKQRAEEHFSLEQFQNRITTILNAK